MSDPMDIRVRGTLLDVDGVGTVRIEVVVPTPVAEVWTAVTEPARLAQWYGTIEGDLRVGGSYHALLFPSGWDGTGHVLECEPPRRLVIESAEEGSSGSRDELELTAEGPGSTRVVLTKRGAPLQWIPAYGVGTQIHLENLAAHLAGRGPIDPDPYWAELLPRYEALAAEL
jgi:uncharacterized protein YndB with AHSA1/START domain